MLWLRTISSTVGGQALDTFFFTFIAFLGVLSIGDVWRIFFMEWLLKVLYESAATPITYAVVGYLKRREGIDVYDDVDEYESAGRAVIPGRSYAIRGPVAGGAFGA